MPLPLFMVLLYIKTFHLANKPRQRSPCPRGCLTFTQVDDPPPAGHTLDFCTGASSFLVRRAPADSLRTVAKIVADFAT